jgi:hypothetical protein
MMMILAAVKAVVLMMMIISVHEYKRTKFYRFKNENVELGKPVQHFLFIG